MARRERGQAERLPRATGRGSADPGPSTGDVLGLHRVTRLPVTTRHTYPSHGYGISLENPCGHQRNSTFSPPHSSSSPRHRRSDAASPLKMMVDRRCLFLCLPVGHHGSPFCPSGSLNNTRRGPPCCRQRTIICISIAIFD